jgi:hypothetical protein
MPSEADLYIATLSTSVEALGISWPCCVVNRTAVVILNTDVYNINILLLYISSWVRDLTPFEADIEVSPNPLELIYIMLMGN